MAASTKSLIIKTITTFDDLKRVSARCALLRTSGACDLFCVRPDRTRIGAVVRRLCTSNVGRSVYARTAQVQKELEFSKHTSNGNGMCLLFYGPPVPPAIPDKGTANS